MKPFRILFTVASFALVCLAGALAGEDKKDEGQNSLKVAIEAVNVRAGVYVGKPLHLKVILHNTTDKSLLIQDWEKCLHVINLRLDTKDYPGQSGGRWGPIGFGRPRLWRGGLRSLPPGETVVERSITPMIPGDLRIAVQVWCPANVLGETKEEKASWQGKAQDHMGVFISAEMSAEMKTRHEDCRAEIERPTVPVEKKLEILAAVAEEKHYFAARFIRETYDAAEPGRVKEAALRHLVDLAMFGTAYESFPLLVKVMEQDDAPQDIRLTLLGWIGEILARQGYQGLAEQAIHLYPAPLQEEARQAIQRLAQDRNPFVAAKAQEVLKRLEGKGK
ncbi:MAG: hypothetical protein WBD63_01090 [Phycisphaerae bacterium]